MASLPNAGEETKKKRKKPDLPIVAVKTTADYQRMKLERLMANPDKVINIAIRPKDKNLPPPPEFVRNIMGSSAGAGSGEFHVYRHLRRKEYTRQKYIQEKAKIEEMHSDFQSKMDQNVKVFEEKTAKKRAKRLKKKQNRLKKKKGNIKQESSSESSESSDDEEQEDQQPSLPDDKAPSTHSVAGDPKDLPGVGSGEKDMAASSCERPNAGGTSS